MGKVYDGIMGLVVGDALGVPYEFKQRDTFKCTDMVGYGTYNQPPGTWSDDSSMTLATLESIISNDGKINLDDIMSNFSEWLYNGHFTAHGYVFDVGLTTRNAIFKYINGEQPLKCGGSGIKDNGNGSLMRILPVSFTNYDLYYVAKVSKLTHAHQISIVACVIYHFIVREILAGCLTERLCEESMDDVSFYINAIPKEFARIRNLKNLSRDDIKSTGYVVDTLEASLWCFLHTDNYRDCVLEAVNLGGDTDTIAAIAGGLAGIYYGVGGEKGIPEEWIEQIARKEWIKELCDMAEGIGDTNECCC